MAKCAGLFGVPHGKLAQLVFATWKGIGYARLYVIPSNPNTTAQQTTRTKFTIAVAMAKAALGSVLHVFWDPFIKDNSGYATFIGKAMTLWHTAIDYSVIKMSEGTLESTPITGCTYAGSTVTFTWSPTCLGNGLATDKACCVVYDTPNKMCFFNGSAIRSAGTVGVSVGAGRNPALMQAYLFFADSSTAPTVKSDSDHSLVT